MAGKLIYEGTSPKTQSIDAIKALLAWKGRASDPLPQFVELGKDESRMILVLSNKKDCYYVATPRACSCPAHTWHPNHQCKHQRRYFPQQETAKPVSSSEPLIQRGGFKPFSLLPGEEAAVKSASSMLIDCFDTSDREAAYQSIKMDRDMWPVEA
jgi:hypothetical protein